MVALSRPDTPDHSGEPLNNAVATIIRASRHHEHVRLYSAPKDDILVCLVTLLPHRHF